MVDKRYCSESTLYLSALHLYKSWSVPYYFQWSVPYYFYANVEAEKAKISTSDPSKAKGKIIAQEDINSKQSKTNANKKLSEGEKPKSNEQSETARSILDILDSTNKCNLFLTGKKVVS